jgi:hypothetical protein
MRESQLSDENTSFVGRKTPVHNRTALSEDEEVSLVRRRDGDRAMSYAARPREFVPCYGATRTAARSIAAPRPGVLRRLFDAVFESRQKQAEREVASYLARTGGRITDDIERRITDRLVIGHWRR